MIETINSLKFVKILNKEGGKIVEKKEMPTIDV